MALPPIHSRESASGTDPPLPSGGSTIVGSITGSTAVAIGQGASVIINQAMSHAEEFRQLEQWEQQKLALAVRSLAQSLADRALAEAPSVGLLQPYEVAEVEHFFGRDQARTELLTAVNESRFVVLSGVAGSGKTSLLRAAIIPELIAHQYLPIEVRAGSTSLSAAIKTIVLPAISLTPTLQAESLQGFLGHVAHLLPHGREVVVILDQLEIFFDTADEATSLAFVQEVGRCINVSPSVVRWIMCVRSSHLSKMLDFSPHISQPLAQRLTLEGMDREQARAVIAGLACLRQVSVQDQAMETILTDLHDDSQDGLILPWKLQLVCHEFIGDHPQLASELSLERYRQLGGVEGSLRSYLERCLNENLDHTIRFVAWEVLATLAEHRHARADTVTILARLRNYDIHAAAVEHVLYLLETSLLVSQSDGSYQIGSMSFLPGIHAWSITQRANAQARAEVERQIDNLRGSALRGLVGGALGLSLTFLLINWPLTRDYTALPYMTMLRAMLGGLVGLILVLFIDMARASYRGAHRVLLWLSGGTAGAFSFGFALLFNYLLRHSGAEDNLLTQLAFAGLQGGVWGIIAGLGTVWALSTTHSRWLAVAVTAAASGLSLWLAESFGHAFCRPMFAEACAREPSAGWLIIGGMLLPIGVMMAALLGPSDVQQLPEDGHRPPAAHETGGPI